MSSGGIEQTWQRVCVRDLGTIREYHALPNIARRDRERVVTVSSGIMGRPLNQVIGDIRSYVDGLDVPPQIKVVFGGDFEDQQDAFGDMFLILLLSMLLTYIVMAAQFESLREPFIMAPARPPMCRVSFLFTEHRLAPLTCSGLGASQLLFPMKTVFIALNQILSDDVLAILDKLHVRGGG